MNEETVPVFDLRHDAWITVQNLDGSIGDVGIVELFARAHQIGCMSNELPTIDFAIIRVLLAVLRQAHGQVQDADETWAEAWAAYTLDVTRIAKYLDKEGISGSFNLLDPVRPFMQVPGLQTAKGDSDSPARLIADVPAGAHYFTTRSGSALDRLGFAEAARWLVHVQAFDYSGIKPGATDDRRVSGGKGYPIGAGWAGQLGGLYLQGATLKETLLLNLHFNERGRDDADSAVWERSALTGASARGDNATEKDPDGTQVFPIGDSDIFTWSSRRVRLKADADGIISALVTNGDRLIPQNSHVFEPMSLWRDSLTQAKALKLDQVWMPKRHDPDRSAWRGLGALIGSGEVSASGAADAGRPAVVHRLSVLMTAGMLPPGYHMNTVLVGFSYGTQDSSFQNLYCDQLSLEASLLTPQGVRHRGMAIDAVKRTETAVYRLGKLAEQILVAGGNDRPTDQGMVLSAVYFEFDTLFRNWLKGISVDQEATEFAIAWNVAARGILFKHSDALLRKASPRSIQGRFDADGHLRTAHTATNAFAKHVFEEFPVATESPEHTNNPTTEETHVQ
ncbi:type I-E CRISPR-associated protein Cse1/CasA [Paeniglutamicibacter cryotolerans]|uniref:CRISPR system Cascade subunit CasA n=1 Tax=Paeniglutamicibacter cryotolerans TaxID=670079 RepID=A0A839QS40_9MICC|nr:type I-E CRISPR-associated protein Cse1/CasA [Paeniglutamicibacter cryotolerans]MBB2997495.1 CRISPR system Cascade subunit CasA [Paeniglutamicibacter cryotolerans]